MVLVVSMLALTSSTILAVVAGVLMAATLPLELIVYLSGTLFIIMGFYTFTKNQAEDNRECQSTTTFLGMFSLVFLSELGDKTQLACLALAAESHFPVLVFIGAIIGFFAVNSMGAIAGYRAADALPIHLIRRTTAAVFIIIGVLIVLHIM